MPSAPYMPVTQGAKMYDLVSRALKKDHEYVSTAIDEVDFMLYRLESARYSRPHDLLYFQQNNYLSTLNISRTYRMRLPYDIKIFRSLLL